jgi:hypothetical protein
MVRGENGETSPQSIPQTGKKNIFGRQKKDKKEKGSGKKKKGQDPVKNNEKEKKSLEELNKLQDENMKKIDATAEKT